MSKQPSRNVGGPEKIGAGLLLLVLLGLALTNRFPFPEQTGSSGVDAASSDNAAQTQIPRGAAATPQQHEDAAPLNDNAQGSENFAAVQPSAQDLEQNAPSNVAPRIGRSLTDVIALLNADKFDEATTLLDQLLTADALAQMTPFEQSRVYQLSFNLNMQKENYAAASADIQAALESGGLNPQETNAMEYQRGQLFVQMEDYAKAADSLALWIAKPDATPSKAAHYLLAASYYYQDKFDDARDVMETLFTLDGENQEGWYSMMASLYIQNEDYAKAKPVLEKMVELYDRDTYREQLRGINQTLSTTQ